MLLVLVYRKCSRNLLALTIAALLATASAAGFATPPAAGQLPGQGKITLGSGAGFAVDTATPGSMTITLGADTLIDWGAGTSAGDINPAGIAGFNIGADATVKVISNSHDLLNIDSSGNASQIFGTLTSTGGIVWVANTNGIIVGNGASISTSLALVANQIISTQTNPFGGFFVPFSGVGGDVTVQAGAAISGNILVISGGGTVNVNLAQVTSSAPSLNAGLRNNVPGSDNPNAALIVTSAAGGSTLQSVSSAGTVTTNGNLTITYNRVLGMLTNNGTLTLNGTANGNVHNLGTLSAAANARFGTLGAYGVNGSLINEGIYNTATGITVNGGNLVNSGVINGAGVVRVNDGSISNTGLMQGVVSLTTASNAADPGFVAGSTYSITNSGQIGGVAGLPIDANASNRGAAVGNDSAGGFVNTGTLTLVGATDLAIRAQDSVNLGGSVQRDSATLATANPLNSVVLTAGGLDGSNNLTTHGALTVSAPVYALKGITLSGAQVNLNNDMMTPSADPAALVKLIAGATPAGGYAVNVAADKTVSANAINLIGDAGHSPNVMLQGTLAANAIAFGTAVDGAGDVVTGATGGLLATGTTPSVIFNFTGRVKTAPSLNHANFRYNYLPISLTADATSPLALTLNPVKYLTNGTSNGKSAVNVLVSGSVTLGASAALAGATVINGMATAVTGVVHVPNTHLVLQVTGNITIPASYYWPGYVYLGNIATNADGSAAPGTLGQTGSITLGGDFSNVLPGSNQIAGGIHFITQMPLIVAAGTKVTTNANSWINFGTELLTQSYTQRFPVAPTFYGGSAGPGNVMTYYVLGPTLFHYHPPVAAQ